MKKIVLLLLLAVLSTACGIKSDDLRVTSFNGGSLSKISGSSALINFQLGVANDSRHTVVIKSAEFFIADTQNEQIATIIFPEKIVIPRRTFSHIEVPVRLKFGGILGALTAASKLKDVENMRVTGIVKVKSGLFTKKIKIENCSVKEIMSNFDGSVIEKLKL